MRKRFIAGAICPRCKQKDTIALFKQAESLSEIVTCVKYAYQFNQIEKISRVNTHNEKDVINYFRLE